MSKKISFIIVMTFCMSLFSPVPSSAVFDNDFPMDMDSMMNDGIWGMGDYAVDQNGMFVENSFVLDNMDGINDTLFFGMPDFSMPVFEITDTGPGISPSIENGDWSSSFNDFYASADDTLSSFGSCDTGLMDMTIMEIPELNSNDNTFFASDPFFEVYDASDLQNLFLSDPQSMEMPIDANAIIIDNPERNDLFQNMNSPEKDITGTENLQFPEFDFSAINDLMNIELPEVEYPDLVELPDLSEEQEEGNSEGNDIPAENTPTT